MKEIIIFSSLLTSVLLYGQTSLPNEKGTGVTVTNVPKINFLTPGISYELKVGKKSTIRPQVFMDVTTVVVPSTRSFFGDPKSYFDPSLMLEYHYYYNQERRESLHKRTAKNSMNYVGGWVQTIFTKGPIDGRNPEQENRRAIYLAGMLYGLQRNFSNRVSFEISLGLGSLWGSERQQALDYTNNNFYYVTVTNSRFTIPGHLSLGIWFGAK